MKHMKYKMFCSWGNSFKQKQINFKILVANALQYSSLQN